MPEPLLKLTRMFGNQHWVLRRSAATKPRGSQASAAFESVALAGGSLVRCLRVERSGKRRAIHCLLVVGDIQVYVEGDPRVILSKPPVEPAIPLAKVREAQKAAAAAVTRYAKRLERRWHQTAVSLRIPKTLGDGSRRLVERPPGTLVYVTGIGIKWHLEQDLRMKIEKRTTTFELDEFSITVTDVVATNLLKPTKRRGKRTDVQHDVSYPSERLRDLIRAAKARADGRL